MYIIIYHVHGWRGPGLHRSDGGGMGSFLELLLEFWVERATQNVARQLAKLELSRKNIYFSFMRLMVAPATRLLSRSPTWNYITIDLATSIDLAPTCIYIYIYMSIILLAVTYFHSYWVHYIYNIIEGSIYLIYSPFQVPLFLHVVECINDVGT